MNKLLKHFLNRVIYNDKGEVPITTEPPKVLDPVTEPKVLDPVVPVEPVVQEPIAPSVYEDLMTKKGFKNNDSFANSYQESEKALHRQQNITNTTKQQLEQHGYTLDDNGNVVAANGGQAVPPQQTQQAQQAQQTQENDVYDPYTGQLITNQMDLQLAQMPLSQRMGVVVNAMLDQRDQQSSTASQAKQDFLNKPEAKGFEDDVKQVMSKMPLQYRVDPKNWDDALLKVKGQRYDQAIKGAGGQAVNDFINKEGVQAIPGSGTGAPGSGVKLTPAQEKTFAYYQETQPGMFKDKAHFLQMNSNTGGR